MRTERLVRREWRDRSHFAERAFGLWAVEVPGFADFVGFVGLSIAARGGARMLASAR